MSRSKITTYGDTLIVGENSGPTAINIPAPTSSQYPTSKLTITVAALPGDGTVLLSDGVTAVYVGEKLTVLQLTGLEFKPTMGAFGQSSTFTYKVTDPSGRSATGTATLAIGADTMPPTTAASLTVAENAAAAPIGIAAPTDPNYSVSQLTVSVTGLPSDGTVLLSDGVTAVTNGQVLTVAQLTGLEFKPTPWTFGQSSTFSYSVTDPSGLSATGTATLAVAADVLPWVTTAASLTVAENAAATPIGIAAPTDPNYSAAQLEVTVTGLPTDGAILLADGATAVYNGEVLTVGQLTTLEFKPTTNLFSASSTFSYTVSDPSGLSANSTATLSIGSPVFNVSGGQIFDPNGSVWHAGGVAVYAADVQAFGASLATTLQTEFPGIKLVRLAISDFSYTPASYAPFVNAITQAGIAAVFEDHNMNQTVLTGSALTAESNWYAGLASYYVSNPYVLFETMNEPGSGDSAQQQATYNAIRSTGNNNLTFMEAGTGAGGGDITSVTPSVYSTMHDVAWDIHAYNWQSNYSTDVATIQADQNQRITNFQTIHAADGVMPVICLETGQATNGTTIDPGGSPEIQATYTNRNFVGAAGWAWDNWGTPGLVNSLTNSGGNSLTSYGQQVASYIYGLSPISFGANTTLGYSANGNNTGGTLTVSDGMHTANLVLLGQYAAAGFATAPDPGGGTIVAYTVPQDGGAPTLLTNP